MNRIVLIGNGFDLAHGLPTRYEDFVDWYWEQWFEKLIFCYQCSESDDLCEFTLNQHPGTWHSHLFSCVPRILHRPKGKDVIEMFRQNPNTYTIKECPFFKEICKSIHEKNWVDIENEYYKFLCSFLADFRYDNPDILNKELDFIKSKLIEYLTSVQETPIKDSSLKNNIRQKIFSPLSPQDISVSASKAWDNFIKDRYELQSDLWEELLINYSGKNIPARLCKINTFKEEYKEQLTGRGDIPKEQFPQDFLLPDRIMLLNFNYTKTADTYLSTASSRFTVNHIHGDLSKPESVIFGYGDELDAKFQTLLQLNENELLRNIKSIRYLESRNYRDLLSFIESAPYQVCIMGHSCGNSDRTLLNTLFEHKNCVSIKPFYHQQEDGSDNYLNIVQNIYRNFTDTKSMRDRVVNKIFCTPLSF